MTIRLLTAIIHSATHVLSRKQPNPKYTMNFESSPAEAKKRWAEHQWCTSIR